mmetsp:Transcript_35046/g.87702  ORF Transcript_35046/g.87702 Transcript_35046/m.87702 type:complete len:201 (-) Transcript_35046:113-715(-)
MRFCARMARSPAASCTMKLRATASVTRPRRLMNSDRSPPAQYSSTRNIRFSSLMISCSLMMLSCLLRCNTLISDSSDSRNLRLSFSSLISLMATSSPVSTCRARHTTAKEPLPICFSTSHRPITHGDVAPPATPHDADGTVTTGASGLAEGGGVMSLLYGVSPRRQRLRENARASSANLFSSSKTTRCLGVSHTPSTRSA